MTSAIIYKMPASDVNRRWIGAQEQIVGPVRTVERFGKIFIACETVAWETTCHDCGLELADPLDFCEATQ